MMHDEELIRMAREAGFSVWPQGAPKFERFAALVAAAEREACAKVCDDNYFAIMAADAIRARGEA